MTFPKIKHVSAAMDAGSPPPQDYWGEGGLLPCGGASFWISDSWIIETPVDYFGKIEGSSPEQKAKIARQWLDLLRSKVEDPYSDQKSALLAFRALEESGRIAVPDIIPFLDSPNPGLRLYAAEALGSIGAREAIRKLEQMVEEDHVFSVQIAARDAIHEMTGRNNYCLDKERKFCFGPFADKVETVKKLRAVLKKSRDGFLPYRLDENNTIAASEELGKLGREAAPALPNLALELRGINKGELAQKQDLEKKRAAQWAVKNICKALKEAGETAKECDTPHLFLQLPSSRD